MSEEKLNRDHSSFLNDYKELLMKIIEVQGLPEEIVLKFLSVKGMLSKD